MSDLVERVARAIAQADEQNGGPPYEYRITLGKHAKEQLFDQARAAIAAMAEPVNETLPDGYAEALRRYNPQDPSTWGTKPVTKS